ncbi:membrane protein [Mycobacterium shottsii]|uniref:Membrane protein n=1 Tax=Mycobacterium shottsii TaxID=133549 RepID=A0A7I7L401_9MYCO|nr:membrane protein [Mycobacterium shottsii]
MSTIRLLPTSRLKAFSDGVYAIVITLLVLDLKVPESSNDLGGALLRSWPAFLAYLVSFVFIGSSWLAHTRLTVALVTADEVFNTMNLLLLLLVTFLPFNSALMSHYLVGPGQRLAVGLFGVNVMLATAASAVLASYGRYKSELSSAKDRATLAEIAQSRWMFSALMGLSVVAVLLLPSVAVAFYLFLSALMLMRPLRILTLGGRRQHDSRENGA